MPELNIIELRKLKFKQLENSTWKDFEFLFGDKGACGGCWCMAWRLSPSQFEIQKGNENKKAFKKLVNKNETLGIIAYYDNVPVGWCAFASREQFIRLNNSKVLARIDEQPVWSITCFFIQKNFRRKGISIELLKAVIKFCKNNKVKILEAYPQEPYSKNIPAAFAWTGIPSAFKKAGFEVAERRSPKRPIMRYYF